MNFFEYMQNFIDIEELYFVGIIILSLVITAIIWKLSKIFYGDPLQRAYEKNKTMEQMTKRELEIWKDYQSSIKSEVE